MIQVNLIHKHAAFWQMLLAAVLIQAWPARAVADPIEIIVRETTYLSQSRIYLGDIAEITGVAFLKEAIAKIDLGPSPRPDKLKSFYKRRIVSMVHRQPHLPEDITITGPDRIYVRRLSQTVSSQDIKAHVEKLLLNRFKDRQCQIVTFSVRGLEPYPQGKITFLEESGDLVDKSGRLSFFMDILVNRKKEDRVSVSGSVAIYETILHAKESHGRGDALARENVYADKKNIFELNGGFIKTFDEIGGKILKTGVNKGESLTNSLFVDPPLVQKGDVVTLIARNQTLVILTTGISKEDGFENEQIRVENLDSGKIVRGVVKEKSKVEVIY